jgi:leucyl aminopeptidase
MVNITLSNKDLLAHNADCYAYIVDKDFDIKNISDSFKNACPELAAIAKHRKFTGNLQEALTVPLNIDGRIAFGIIVGMGKEMKSVSTIERYRRAVGQIVKEVQANKGTSVALHVSFDLVPNATPFYFTEQTVIILQLAQYHFDDYITDRKSKEHALKDIIIVADEKYAADSKDAVHAGTIIAQAVNQARHWIDTPPSQLTPQDLVTKAQEIADRNNLKMTAFHEPEIIKMGMGGLAGVSKGSDIDCALIILEYHAKKDAPTLCFVGKGITFDSGGLSLKPADYMETMKEDMSGAAAVLCAIDALAQLKPDLNIIAIAPTSENLPSGHATKPGDIVTFYNGKTAEIKNTDAEGRLILADALSYAVKHYSPDIIVDLATLTGACSRALGPVYSGLFGEHEDLIEKLYEAAEISGDRLWRLPMGDEYEKAIKSTVADICNIGSKQIPAGASTAAHFLQHFVDDVTWAHIDIAGTAFDVPNISYYRPGGTGVGVRLLIALAMNWNK